MALRLDWILEKLAFASKASSMDEIRIRNSIISNRISHELGEGETEAQQSPPRDTKALDEASARLEQVAQRDDIDGQIKEDLTLVLSDLEHMYKLTRWGKK